VQGNAQRFALPALGRAAERRPTGKMLRRGKRLGIAPESPASGARFVRRTRGTPTFFIDNEHQTHLDKILPTIKTLAITKKHNLLQQIYQNRHDC